MRHAEITTGVEYAASLHSSRLPVGHPELVRIVVTNADKDFARGPNGTIVLARREGGGAMRVNVLDRKTGEVDREYVAMPVDIVDTWTEHKKAVRDRERKAAERKRAERENERRAKALRKRLDAAGIDVAKNYGSTTWYIPADVLEDLLDKAGL